MKIVDKRNHEFNNQVQRFEYIGYNRSKEVGALWEQATSICQRKSGI